MSEKGCELLLAGAEMGGKALTEVGSLSEEQSREW